MKLLYITSLSGKRINGFMRSAIVAARELGFEFTLACNMEGADIKAYKEDCENYGIHVVNINFDRNPISRKNIIAYNQLCRLMRQESFDVVHCNTPIGGVLGRICSKICGVGIVIYQAHGFHFWKGAPIKNWLLYYPVERILAHYTDFLITINQEDYRRARSFSLKQHGQVVYVHGVGVNIKKFIHSNYTRKKIRKELLIPQDARVFISVGELNENKNHLTAVKSFINSNIENSYYLICGNGPAKYELEAFIRSNHKENFIKLLGFRSDIADILNASDFFIFPSIREGLSVALMEAMVAGLPCICSCIRGNTDLLGEEYPYYFESMDTAELTNQILKISNDHRNWSEYVKTRVQPFEFSCVVKELKNIYEKCLKI